MQKSTTSKRNKMPGLRLKRGIWQIEKRCRYAQGGWLRESTGTTSRTEAERTLIRRLAELEMEAHRKDQAIFLFEEAALRYLKEVAHKSSADTIAMHLDHLFPFIGATPLALVHNGTIEPYIEHELKRGLSPKSINNGLAIVSTVLNRAARVWRDEYGRPWLSQAPALISRLPLNGRQSRPYPLSWAEQDRMFKLLPRHLADAALYAVNTGCREQEVCQLRWDWEVKIPELDTSVFILPAAFTKTRVERVVVLNSIASRIVQSRRGKHEERVFTFRDKPIKKLRASAWRRAWREAGLPEEPGILKGVHNLRHTCGRRLRSAGVSLETRKAILGHANGDITTHYSAAELSELINAAEKIVDRKGTDTPSLTVIAQRTVKVSDTCRKLKKG